MTRVVAEWVERFARLGYATKGVVYITIGLLATMAACHLGGETTDSSGVLFTIARQPFGQILLMIVAIGLAGYVLWRFVQAINDPEHSNAMNAKAVFRRVGYAINGLAYAGIAFTAVQILINAQAAQTNDSGDSAQLWTGRLMAQPFGQWLVGTAGAWVIGLGFYYFYRAVKTKFQEPLKLNEMSQFERTWATRLGMIGITARGVIFLVIGGFLIQAARLADPSEVKNSEGAVDSLQQGQPFGSWLLIFVALGLIAYGIHLTIQARYRRIDPM